MQPRPEKIGGGEGEDGGGDAGEKARGGGEKVVGEAGRVGIERGVGRADFAFENEKGDKAGGARALPDSWRIPWRCAG